MAKYKLRKLGGSDIFTVVNSLVRTILALYVGGTLITTFGTVMNCTHSPFYDGLSLIGWTVSDNVFINTTLAAPNTCSGAGTGLVNLATYNNLIVNPTGSGVLSVVGLIAIAKVLLQVIKF